jgi:nucleotide-binding universal stress UspA family protein
LICYDRSADSRVALERATQLFADHPATVLTVWEPLEEQLRRTPLAYAGVTTDDDLRDVDEASRIAADEAAAEGVDLAQRLGMTAHPRSAARTTTTGQAILAEAKALGATAIVMGSRGLTGVKSLLLGSVVHEVIQHADRAVVVVPSQTLAASRVRAAR